MNAPRTYAYKPALLRGETSTTLDKDRLRSDEGWEIALGDVTRAAFVNHVFRGARMMRLDLGDAAQTRSLSFTGDAREWRTDPGARVFLDLVRDTLRALEATQPGTEVILGEHGRARRAMFAVGLVAVVAGLGIFAGALATGLPADRLLAAAVPMLLLTALGAALIVSYRPGRRPPAGKAARVAQVIDEIVAGLETPASGQDGA